MLLLTPSNAINGQRCILLGGSPCGANLHGI